MKIALLGYGKMGKTIDALIQKKWVGKHEVVLKIDKHNAPELTPKLLAKADVAIEFSTPKTAVSNILSCFEANVPVVVGTTAWHEQLPKVTAICNKKNQSLLYASNFSIGVNIFFALNRKLAKMMNRHFDYQLQIDEIHHLEKLDAPSGTAITLANGIIHNNQQKQTWINQASDNQADVPIISHREKDVKGTHIITYASAIDTLEIKHTAHSREGFAHGAILASQWLLDKKGIFTIQDMLQF